MSYSLRVLSAGFSISIIGLRSTLICLRSENCLLRDLGESRPGFWNSGRRVIKLDALDKFWSARDVSDINLFTLTNGIFCCSGCLYDKIFSLLSVNGDLKLEDFGRNLTLLTFKVSSFSDSFLYGIKALKEGGFFSSNSESSLWG